MNKNNSKSTRSKSSSSAGTFCVLLVLCILLIGCIAVYRDYGRNHYDLAQQDAGKSFGTCVVDYWQEVRNDD